MAYDQYTDQQCPPAFLCTVIIIIIMFFLYIYTVLVLPLLVIEMHWANFITTSGQKVE